MEKFETNLIQFYEELKTIVPDLFKKDGVDDGLCIEVSLPEGSDERVYFFVENWYPHMEYVSKGDLEHFVKSNISPDLFPNLSFIDVMSVVNEKNRSVIWEYLHTLFIWSMSTDQVKEKRDGSNPETDRDKLIKETIDEYPNLIVKMVSWKRNKAEPENNEPSPEIDETFLENSSISKLAREISQEIDIDEMKNLQDIQDPTTIFKSLLSGDDNSGIGKLLKTVTDKLKTKMESGEVNQEDLFKDANTLLQSMGKNGSGSSGMPDLSNFMNMAQNLASMGDLFNQNMPMPTNRKSKKKMKKMGEKIAKRKHKKRGHKKKDGDK